MKHNKIILHIVLMVLTANLVSAEKYFALDFNYIIGSVTFNSISLREIDRNIQYNDKSGFLIKTISFENLEISKIYYNMSENKNYVIYVPYDKDAARIEVYNLKNSKVMDIDISSFADTCGNNICEEHESYESCTKDCSSGSKDDFCDGISDGICDSDCSAKTDADCAEEEINETQAIQQPISKSEKTKEIKEAEPEAVPNYFIWILVALLVAVIALIFLLVKKRKESKIIESLKGYISENIRRGFTLQQIKDALFREGYSEKEIDKAVKGI